MRAKSFCPKVLESQNVQPRICLNLLQYFQLITYRKIQGKKCL